jgi:hypothetical protein
MFIKIFFLVLYGFRDYYINKYNTTYGQKEFS